MKEVKKMIIHKAINPNTDQGNAINFCWITLVDHNNVLSTNLNENQTVELATLLLQRMEMSPNEVGIAFNLQEPIGMRIREERFEETKEMIENEGFTAGSEYKIRDILAATLTITFTNHEPNINICDMEFNLINSVRYCPIQENEQEETEIYHNEQLNYEEF